MKKVAIVALDMNIKHENFAEYNSLDATDKILHLSERIEAICQQLDVKEPDANWLISWREYGITSPNSKFVSNDEKKLFKKATKELTRKYPKLTIISGAMATKKDIFPSNYKAKLESIIRFYQHPSLQQLTSNQVDLHLQHVIALNLTVESLDSLNIVRNTCYQFSQGECIYRHDKLTPNWETVEPFEWFNATDEENKDSQLEDTVFQPGNKKNNSNLYTINSSNGDVIQGGIEICFEHRNGVLKKEITQNKHQPPLIHIISSAAMSVKLDKLCGEYNLLLDYRVKPQLIIDKDVPLYEMENLPVHLYQNDLFENEAIIYGPTQPLYPVELGVLKEFEKIKNLVVESSIVNKEMHIKMMDSWMNELIDHTALGKDLSPYLERILAYITPLVKNINSSGALNEEAKFAEMVNNVVMTLATSRTNLRPLKNAPSIETELRGINLDKLFKRNLQAAIDTYINRIILYKTTNTGDPTLFGQVDPNHRLIAAKIFMAESLIKLIDTTDSANEVLKILRQYIDINDRIDKLYKHTDERTVKLFNLSDLINEITVLVSHEKNAKLVPTDVPSLAKHP